uniref:Pru domain-containing protein n=1 Tax=Strongyloides stercoralis TaxID=6248 RepID=A0A0K0E6E1_STRER
MSAALEDTFTLLSSYESVLYKFRCDRFLPLSENSRNILLANNKRARGLLFIVKTLTNQTHFCWVNSGNNIIVDDYVLFLNNTVFKEVGEYPDGRVAMLGLMGTNKKIFYLIQESDKSKSDAFFKDVEEIVKHCNGFQADFPSVPSLDDRFLSDSNRLKRTILLRLIQDEISQLTSLVENTLTEFTEILSDSFQKNNIFLGNLKVLREDFTGISKFDYPVKFDDVMFLLKALRSARCYCSYLAQTLTENIGNNRNEGEIESSSTILPLEDATKAVNLENQGEEILNQFSGPKKNIEESVHNNNLDFDKESSTEFSDKESSNKN